MLTLQEKIKAVRLQQLLDHFATTKFVQYETTVTLLYKGWLNNHHVVLYGRGGFGKSEMVQEFFNFIQTAITAQGYDTPTVGLLDAGKCSTSKLWGGYDPTQLPNEVYRLESSWISYDYFVFEELFDAYLAALQTMKQTMTSKRYSSPFQDMVVRNQFLVCLTNMSPAEVLAKLDPSDQNTIQALLDRFPLQLLHEWSTESLQDNLCWAALFERCTELDDLSIYFLSTLCRNIHRAKGFINPRMAIRIADACVVWATVCNSATNPYYLLEVAPDYLDAIGKQQLWLLQDALVMHKPQPPVVEVDPIDPSDYWSLLMDIVCRLHDIDKPTMQTISQQGRWLVRNYPDNEEVATSAQWLERLETAWVTAHGTELEVM